MQRIFKAISIWLFPSILLASCGPVTRVPTVTALPLRTFVPTNTGLPEPSATATLSFVESPFSIPTNPGILPNTPTPILTPVGEASSARLKIMTEDDALNLLNEMHEYSYRNFPPFLGWWTEGQFVASQEPVALIIQEYLYRFPDSLNANRLRWQMAFIDSIVYDGLSGNKYGDKWILAELQKRLDEGEKTPDQLESILDQYWLEVDYFQPIENLFGDGKTAWFYVIGPQVWQEEEGDPKSPDYIDRGGLYFIVQDISDGKFQVHFLENDWDFSNGSNSVYEISDHNRNGIPEIALNLWRHGGTICTGHLKIFEWIHGSFRDLTRGEIEVSDCTDHYEYTVVKGKPSIVIEKVFPQVPAAYTWNGTYYEFSEYQYSNPMERWLSAESFSEEIQSIEALLASEDRGGISPSQIDFLRYRLGLVYALDSQVLQAQRVLQGLVDNPMDKSGTVYSDFAKNFLRYYKGNETLSLACKKSREILDKTTEIITAEDEEVLFGFPLDFSFGFGLLRCFERDVFDLLVRETSTVVDNVPGELRKNGMNLFYAEPQDVNLDGLVEEWLIIIDDGMFVVLPDDVKYKAVELDYFWYGEDVTQYSNVALNIQRWKGIADTILTVSTADELLILEIGDDFTSQWLDSEYDVEKVFFAPQADPAQFQVFHEKPDLNEDYYGVPWSGYRWDPETEKFRDDLLEYTLFIERNPDKALKLVNTVYPYLMEWKDLESVSYDFPRYLYLCALTYELSGDEQKAAEIFWQLWHDFPGSHYALMARYKLEPVNQ